MDGYNNDLFINFNCTYLYGIQRSKLDSNSVVNSVLYDSQNKKINLQIPSFGQRHSFPFIFLTFPGIRTVSLVGSGNLRHF